MQQTVLSGEREKQIQMIIVVITNLITFGTINLILSKKDLIQNQLNMRRILLSLALLSTVISAWAQNNTLVYTFNTVDQTATVTWVKDKDGKRIH